MCIDFIYIHTHTHTHTLNEISRIYNKWYVRNQIKRYAEMFLKYCLVACTSVSTIH